MPVAIIVTVGAGALMILTGKANDMLAVRADTGTASPTAAATGTSGAPAGARPTAGVVPPAFVSATLSGYPGQRGTVTVASMMAAGGVTLAVGTADGHPAIWRRASNGSWTLESAAALSAVTGSAGLASVAHGPAGWIAVGSTSDGRATGAVVLASADGVQWQPVSSLAAQAGTGTEFLGTAAGRSGYVVVGRQMVAGRTFAVLWYSADLRSWTADNNDGLDGRLAASTVNAVAATSGGFVAVGSHGADQSMWVSSDGRRWNLDYVSPPPGAASATLSSVAASGTQVVAGGYAATRSRRHPGDRVLRRWRRPLAAGRAPGTGRPRAGHRADRRPPRLHRGGRGRPQRRPARRHLDLTERADLVQSGPGPRQRDHRARAQPAAPWPAPPSRAPPPPWSPSPPPDPPPPWTPVAA